VLLFCRVKFAPPATATLSAVSIALILPGVRSLLGGDEPMVDESSPLLSNLYELASPQAPWIAFALFLFAFLGVGALLYSKSSQEWFGLPAPQDARRNRLAPADGIRWGQICRAFLLAAVAWRLLSYVALGGSLAFVMPDMVSESVIGSLLTKALSWFDLLIPFLAACAIFVWSLGEGLIVDSSGIRMLIPQVGLTPFKASWQRITRIDFVCHKVHAPAAVVHYRGLFGFPMTFSVHAKRYVQGEDAISDIRQLAGSNDVPTSNWYCSDNAPIIALVLIAIGLLLCVYSLDMQSTRWALFVHDRLPLNRFHEIAAPIPLALLYVASTVCFGAALGVLSAFHQAGPRPFLLVLWLALGIGFMPSPLLHWLVWIAVYGILLARSGQSPLEAVGIPPPGQLGAGIDIVSIAPLFSGLAYVLGLILACRRVVSYPLAPRQ
jgi:hypothetical protein